MLEFARGVTSGDLLSLGIDPEQALAWVLAHNCGRDYFEGFALELWEDGCFEAVERWYRRSYAHFSHGMCRVTLVMLAMADLRNGHAERFVDGELCNHNPSDTDYLEAGDTYAPTLTLDSEGVIRVETYADVLERWRDEAPITDDEFYEGLVSVVKSMGADELVHRFYSTLSELLNTEACDAAREAR